MSEDTKLAVEENEIKNPPAVEEETIFPKDVPVPCFPFPWNPF